MRENPRDQENYIRFLELMSVITEEWGEAAKDINNYIWKGWVPDNAAKALQELQQLQSPLNELAALLELDMRRRTNEIQTSTELIEKSNS